MKCLLACLSTHSTLSIYIQVQDTSPRATAINGKTGYRIENTVSNQDLFPYVAQGDEH